MSRRFFFSVFALVLALIGGLAVLKESSFESLPVATVSRETLLAQVASVPAPVVESSAVAYVSNSGTTNPLTVTLAGAPSSGDLLIVNIWGNTTESGRRWSAPGWVSVHHAVLNDVWTEVLYRVADGSESNEFTFTPAQGYQTASAVLWHMSGAANPASVPLSIVTAQGNGASGSFDSPSVSTPTENSLVFRLYLPQYEVDASIPSGTTLVKKSLNGGATQIVVRHISSGASAGAATWTNIPTWHTGVGAMTIVVAPDTSVSAGGDTIDPTVSVSAPTTGATVSNSVTLSASASDDTGVSGVRFKIDGAAVGSEDTSSPYGITWDSTSVANGAHTVTATARDAAGNTKTSAAISITVSNAVPAVDATAPVVSVSAPAAAATVSGSVTVSANASDAVGVSGVQFKLDGANLGSEDTSSPYSVSWDTTGASNGSHVLTATARDAAGNTQTSASVSVTVSNAVAQVGAGNCPMLITQSTTLTQDITCSGTAIVIKGNNIVLDLGGHTVQFGAGDNPAVPNKDFDSWTSGAPNSWTVLSGSVQRIASIYGFGTYDLFFSAGGGKILSDAFTVKGGRTYDAFAFVKTTYTNSAPRLRILRASDGVELAAYDTYNYSRGFASTGNGGALFKPASDVSVKLELTCNDSATNYPGCTVGGVFVEQAFDYGIVTNDYFSSSLTPDIASSYFGPAANVTVKNGTIEQAGTGADGAGISYMGGNWTIQDVTIRLKGMNMGGIDARYPGGLTLIQNNSIYYSGEPYIQNRMYPPDAISVNAPSGVVRVEGNLMDNYPEMGISLYNCINNGATSYSVKNNRLYGNARVTENYAIALGGGIQNADVSFNTIQPKSNGGGGRAILIDTASGCSQAADKAEKNIKIHDNQIINAFEKVNAEYPDPSNLEAVALARVRSWPQDGQVAMLDNIEIYDNTATGFTSAGGYAHAVYGVNINAANRLDNVKVYGNTINVTATGAGRTAAPFAVQDTRGQVRVYGNAFTSNSFVAGMLGSNDGEDAENVTVYDNTFTVPASPASVSQPVSAGFWIGVVDVGYHNNVGVDLTNANSFDFSRISSSGSARLTVGRHKIDITVNAGSSPVAIAAVVLKDAGGKVVMVQTTDASGKASVYAPAVVHTFSSTAGAKKDTYADGSTFTLEISKTGYQTQTQPLTVSANKVITVDLGSGQSVVEASPSSSIPVAPAPTPASTKFSLNARVQVSSGPLNVRASASTAGTLLGTQSTGALGLVSGGPVAANGYNWWQVNFDSGVDGWSVEDFLSAYSAPAAGSAPAGGGGGATGGAGATTPGYTAPVSSPVKATSVTGGGGGAATTPKTFLTRIQPLALTRDLTLGMTHDEVKILQQYLNTNGFVITATGPGSPGNETMYFGQLTQGAVRRFQSKNGLMATGIVDAVTRKALGSATLPSTSLAAIAAMPTPAVSFSRSLTIGATGEDVRALQKLLNAKGFMVSLSGPGSAGNETTTFGPATQAALAKWQAANGIQPAVGYFGPLTRAALGALPVPASAPIKTPAVTSAANTCPAPHYGLQVVGSIAVCLPSCGTAGGTASFIDACENHGMKSAGRAYDVKYCCKK